MLTARGWWFLVVVFTLLVLGLFGSLATLGFLGLTLLLWFCVEWLLFALRSRVVVRQLALVREVRDERGPVDNLWAGRSFRVRVKVRLHSALSLPFVSLADWIPFGVEHISGETQCDGSIKHGELLELTYRIHCPAVGRIRFEGVQVRLADLQGLFYHRTFLRGVVSYRVLPVLVNETGQPATSKRHNLLPPPGIHRLRRPGTGSELLNLRDYLPGDPPKTIAWKVSARRDRLITKEFESEVPLRCTLFVDTSNSVRLGPPGQNALTRLIEIAVAVAQVNTGVRDLTGLCLFDDTTTKIVRPARTTRHLAHLFNVLADAAGLPPTTAEVGVSSLLPLAYTFAEEVYPDEMRQDLNRVPFWMPWLWPMPGQTERKPTWGGRLLRWLFTCVCFFPVVLFLLVFSVVYDLTYLLVTEYVPDLPDLLPEPRTYYFIDFVSGVLPDLPEFLPGPRTDIYFFLLAAFLFLYYKLTRRVYRALPLIFSSRRRRLGRWRKKLAALLSARYGLAPGGLAGFLEDDSRLALYLQRFLAEHHVPYALPLYDRQGRYLFAAPAKVDVLARALLQAVSKGRDNELFVLLVDLLELDDRLDPLLRAVRVALARHHQVVVICPWPPGVPPPPAGQRSEVDVPRPMALGQVSLAESLRPALRRIATSRLHHAFQRIRRTFARMGVMLVNAQSDEPVQLVLDRLDRLRTLRRKR